jgi:large subunit ribosomal protein L22
MSPRKVRRVIPLVKGKSVDEALTILRFLNKAAAGPLAKTIQSATANALSEEGTSRLKAEDLSVTQIRVDEGPRAKRIRFRAMGRVYRYKKRFAHLTVVVEGEPEEEPQTKKRSPRKAAKKTEEKEAAPKKTTRKPAAKKAAKKTTARKKPAARKSTAKKEAGDKPAKKTAAKKATTKKSSSDTKSAPKTKKAATGKKTKSDAKAKDEKK